MISIIVPVYNAERYILQTMDSVAAQTFADWELLLVDDCSQDRSAELIEQYIDEHPGLRIRLIRQDGNAGAAAARNRGLDEAKGRYIAFLDADDLWYEQKLGLQLQFARKTHAGVVFTASEFGDEQAVPTGKQVRVPRTLTYRQALSRTIIFTSTVLLDTQIIDKSLMRMPSVESEDTATWWQILRAGHTAYGLNRLLVVYRRPAGSLSANKKTAVRRIWNLYRKEAKLSVPSAALAFAGWGWRATARRVLKRSSRGMHAEHISENGRAEGEDQRRKKHGS